MKKRRRGETPSSQSLSPRNIVSVSLILMIMIIAVYIAFKLV
jgi:hypothetical protein